jgi:hypothetical protein
MRFIDALCPPALLYLIYSVVHIGLDVSQGLFVTALIKLVMGVTGVVVLDALCGVELGVVSWAIVATPFIIMALATSISLGMGIDRLVARYLKEGFSGPLTGDNLKNRDVLVTQLKQEDAVPISTSSLY